jgi:hypothetical protein
MFTLYYKRLDGQTMFYGDFDTKAKAKLIGRMMIRTGRAIKWSLKP